MDLTNLNFFDDIIFPYFFLNFPTDINSIFYCKSKLNVYLLDLDIDFSKINLYMQHEKNQFQPITVTNKASNKAHLALMP